MDGLFLTSRQHWWEQVNNTVIEFHLSVTSGSRWARTRIARLTNRDANHCAILLPPVSKVTDQTFKRHILVLSRCYRFYQLYCIYVLYRLR